MKVALVLFAFAVVALALPTNRPRKPFRPIRVHRRIEETTTIRTYQPKYNPFKSTELSTSTLSSFSPLEKDVSSSSPTKIPLVKLIEDLSTDPTLIVASVEESSVSLSSGPPPSPPGSEVTISFPELFSPSLSSTLSPDAVSFSPLLIKPSHSTSKPLIASSTTKRPNFTSAFKTPILLRPSSSVSPFIRSHNPKSSPTSSVLPSTHNTLTASEPSSSSGTPLRVPKTLTSSVFPSSSFSPLSKPSQTSAASVPPSASAPLSLRTPKSLPTPVSSFSQTSKSPVSTVSQSSFESAPPRSAKSVSLQESDDSANSASVNYSFSYKINDPKTSQDFGHSENRVGKNTKGRYDVLLPDGRRQVVDYQILNDSGYVADVSYQG